MSYSKPIHSKKRTPAGMLQRRLAKKKRDERSGRNKVRNDQFPVRSNPLASTEKPGFVEMVVSAIGGVFGAGKDKA